MKKTLTQHLVLAFLLCLGTSAFAVTNTYIDVNSNYADPANWSLGHVPLAAEDISVPGGSGVNTPTISSGAYACHNISVTGNLGFYITTGSLTVSGAINFTGTGAFIVNQGQGGNLVQLTGSTYSQTSGAAHRGFGSWTE